MLFLERSLDEPHRQANQPPAYHPNGNRAEDFKPTCVRLLAMVLITWLVFMGGFSFLFFGAKDSCCFFASLGPGGMCFAGPTTETRRHQETSRILGCGRKPSQVFASGECSERKAAARTHRREQKTCGRRDFRRVGRHPSAGRKRRVGPALTFSGVGALARQRR
jgi:hypothetical protein